MSKKTEGALITSISEMEFDLLPETIQQKLKSLENELKALPRFCRFQFVQDVKKTIGNVEDSSVPHDLKPLLRQLLQQAAGYIAKETDNQFLTLCEYTIHRASQGWSYLSYWACSEQSRCYSLYWGLKAVMEKHKKQLTLFTGIKNEGKTHNEHYPSSSSRMPSIARFNFERQSH